MKVAQNDETNPRTQPVHPPHVPSIANLQSCPQSVCPKTRNTGNTFPDVFPLRRYHLLPRQGTPNTARCHVMHHHAYVCIIFIVSSPSSLARPRDRRRCYPVRLGVDDLSLLPEQPGKPPLITGYRLFLPS